MERPVPIIASFSESYNGPDFILKRKVSFKRTHYEGFFFFLLFPFFFLFDIERKRNKSSEHDFSILFQGTNEGDFTSLRLLGI